MIGLETCYAVLNTCLENINREKLVAAFIYQFISHLWQTGEQYKRKSQASLTLFNPQQPWTVTEADLKSKSKNSPFIGKALKGKVIGTINKDSLFLNK